MLRQVIKHTNASGLTTLRLNALKSSLYRPGALTALRFHSNKFAKDNKQEPASWIERFEELKPDLVSNRSHKRHNNSSQGTESSHRRSSSGTEHRSRSSYNNNNNTNTNTSKASVGKANAKPYVRKPLQHNLYQGILETQKQEYQTIDVPNQPEVPKLEHNLDRVLFNPGVHVLQDPRSNVYNFTPYLQQVMPVQEFDFDMVSQYITSSKDQALGTLAKEHKKKYIGSTSSMTGVLSQFHHLLSQNRLLNISELSKNFPGDTTTFTKWQRGPASVFLVKKPKLGIYAIDSDKSYDQEIVLSLLGKTLEQLLTTPEIEFENYRKNTIPEVKDNNIPSQAIEEPKDVYQYSKCAGFVMRSQLDCVDKRLPGSGVFDLKTRAVCAVRHDMYHVESNGGTNYQIKRLVGSFESYEREYHEMIRATLLKYSLQARIGNMDGIFVAYHNIRKLFGFQYLPLADMDKIIHGYNGKSPDDYKVPVGRQALEFIESVDNINSGKSTRARTYPYDYQEDVSSYASNVAEDEFLMSMKLWSITLDRFCQDHPDKSMRLIFHASTETEGLMDIYVAPMEEKDISQLQDRGVDTIVETSTASEEAAFEEDAKDVNGNNTSPKLKYPSKAIHDKTIRELMDEIVTIEEQVKTITKYTLCTTSHINGRPIGQNLNRPSHPTPRQGENWTLKFQLNQDHETPAKIIRKEYFEILKSKMKFLESDARIEESTTTTTVTANETEDKANEGEWNNSSESKDVEQPTTLTAADLGSPYQKFMRHIATKGNDYEIQKQLEMSTTGKVVWFPKPIEYFKQTDKSSRAEEPNSQVNEEK